MVRGRRVAWARGAAPVRTSGVHDPARPVEPRPTEEDLLIVYVDGPVPNEWLVTIEAPDGYRLVLCRRGWSNG